MQIGAVDQQALAMQMQMITQMSSVTQDAQMSTSSQVAKVEQSVATNDKAMADSIAAMASGTIDSEVVTEIYA
jgi:hypothetical protein